MPSVAERGNEVQPGDEERSCGHGRCDSEQDGYDGIHGLRPLVRVLSPERRCLMKIPQGPPRSAFLRRRSAGDHSVEKQLKAVGFRQETGLSRLCDEPPQRNAGSRSRLGLAFFREYR
jgi:hypothetical protein